MTKERPRPHSDEEEFCMHCFLKQIVGRLAPAMDLPIAEIIADLTLLTIETVALLPDKKDRDSALKGVLECIDEKAQEIFAKYQAIREQEAAAEAEATPDKDTVH